MPNGRCRMHGGSTPKGNLTALKHGIYSSALSDDEKDLWHQIEIGGLDDELKMARLQYLRALRADKEELAEKLLGRIASMEKTRAELAGDGGTEDEIDELEVVEYEEGDS